MTIPTTFLSTALVLVLAATACSGDSDGGDQAVVESETTTDSQPAADALPNRGSDGSSSGSAEPSATGASAPAAEDVLGTVRADLPNTATGVDVRVLPVRIDVVELRRDGDLVELRFALTNELPPSTSTSVDAIEDPDAFWMATRFGAEPAAEDLSGMRLVGQGADQVYHPVVDDRDGCLCTGNLLGVYIQPGHTVDLTATFGDLPDDVTTLDVHLPEFPPVTNVPLG